MTPGRYTELFFLDEATALAAGHRPCAECQHERYVQFRTIWSQANPELAGGPAPSADDVDRVLHAERLDAARRKGTWRSPLSELPPGTLVADEQGAPWLVLEQRLVRWEPCGYRGAVSKSAGSDTVLTPRSIVNALRAGFSVTLHPSSFPG